MIFEYYYMYIYVVAVAAHQWIHNVHHYVLRCVHLNQFVPIHVLLQSNWNQIIVAHLCQSPVCHVLLNHAQFYLAPHALSFVRPAQVVHVLLVHLYLNQFLLLLKSDLFIEHQLLLVDYSIWEQLDVILAYHMLVELYQLYHFYHISVIYNKSIKKIFIT